ncbi:hypothetical protein [Sandarakinorhabdus rubra]|uniref:hypothetical protein n=1 Tax=Sandarakinorhabdus rubra TaxID=2672568 RepID=UPI0013DC0A23|nr:hypothetical protein [Sandarakinorhabdus rubra]
MLYLCGRNQAGTSLQGVRINETGKMTRTPDVPKDNAALSKLRHGGMKYGVGY